MKTKHHYKIIKKERNQMYQELWSDNNGGTGHQDLKNKNKQQQQQQQQSI